MSPAIAAARSVGPPIVGGNASIESSGAFIAALFDDAGGGDIESIGRGGSEPVGSAVFGDGDRGTGAAGAGAGVAVGAAPRAALGAALGAGLELDGGAAMSCAAGAAVAAGSASELCDGLPPVLAPGAKPGAAPGTAPGVASGAARGTGATSGIGGVGAAEDGCVLPVGCEFFSGSVIGAGNWRGDEASPAGQLS